MKKLSLLTLLLVISCTTNDKFENFLLQKEKKWVYINNMIILDSLDKYEFLYYLRFDDNGMFRNYYISNNTIYWATNTANWFYNQKDSTLILYGNSKKSKLEFKILNYVKDTIFLENSENKKEYLINRYQLAPASR